MSEAAGVVTARFQQLSVDFEPTKVLGNGAYGVVYQVKFLNCDYAFKIVHTAPLAQVDPKALERFEQECSLMNSLKHSNLVLSCATISMGWYPVLVMELMDCNLNKFLEIWGSKMGLNHEFGIAADIISGIQFLHQNNVVHRDLSGANVLMSGLRAKISDLGMAKLLSAFQLNQLTPCPGHQVYMPFTALQEPPIYNENIDIFCFGVLLVQILTRRYPCPTSCIVEENGQRICVSEIERRKDHIEAISNEHALKEVALSCLCENLEAPSAASIKKHMETIVKRPEPAVDLICKQNMQVVAEQQHFISQLISEQQALQAANKKSEEVIQKLAERVSDLELDKKTMHDNCQNQLEAFASKFRQSLREEASMEIERIKTSYENEVKEVKSTCVHALNQTIGEIQALQIEKAEIVKVAEEKIQESLHLQHEISQLSISRSSTDSELSFDDDDVPPACMNLHRDSAAVVYNEAIFLRPARTSEILKYFNGHWTSMLHSKVENCALAFLSGRLTTIGGRSVGAIGKVVGDVYCISQHMHRAEQWVKDVPAMAVARELPQTVASGKTLIVVGGRNKSMLDTVELYNEDFKQWHTACKLPVPLHYITMATFDESLTIVGIRGSRELDESVCLRCKLTDLIYSCSSSLNTANIWEKTKLEIPPKSSLVKFKGRFLSIGGVAKDGRTATSSVYSHSPDTDTWTESPSLRTPRYLCFTAILSDKLYIIGGDMGANRLMNSVEVGMFE